MSNDSIKRVVGDYLSLIRTGRRTKQENESELTRLLDELVVSRHAVDFQFDVNEYPDPPDWPYDERQHLVEDRFPDYGYYNLADPVPEKVGEGEIVVADAIDDIADIAGDLAAVEWRWRNTTVRDALWHFELSYQTHWGRHLRSLQLYLFCRA